MSTLYADPSARWLTSSPLETNIGSILNHSAEKLAQKLSPVYARVQKFMSDKVESVESISLKTVVKTQTVSILPKTPSSLLIDHMNAIKANVRSGIISAFKKENLVANTAPLILQSKMLDRRARKIVRKALQDTYVATPAMTLAKLQAMTSYCSHEALMAESEKMRRRAGFSAMVEVESSIKEGLYNNIPVRNSTVNFNFDKISEGLKAIKTSAELATSNLLIGIKIFHANTVDKLNRVHKFMSDKVSNISFGNFVNNEKRLSKLALVVAGLALTAGVIQGLTPAEALTSANLSVHQDANPARSAKIQSESRYRDFINNISKANTQSMKDIGTKIAANTKFETFSLASVMPHEDSKPVGPVVRVPNLSNFIPNLGREAPVVIPMSPVVTKGAVHSPQHTNIKHIVTHSTRHTGVSVSEDHELRMMEIRRNDIMAQMSVTGYKSAQNIKVSYNLSQLSNTPTNLIEAQHPATEVIHGRVGRI